MITTTLRYFLVFLLVGGLSACVNETAEEIKLENHDGAYEISINQDEPLKSLLDQAKQRFPGKEIPNLTQVSRKNVINTSFGLISTEKVLKYVKDGRPTYSFLLLNLDGPEFQFENLILQKLEKRGYLAYIAQYTPDKDYLISAYNPLDLSNFTGEISRYNLNRELIASKTIINGQIDSKRLDAGALIEDCLQDVKIYYVEEEAVNKHTGYPVVSDDGTQTVMVIDLIYGPCDTVPGGSYLDEPGFEDTSGGIDYDGGAGSGSGGYGDGSLPDDGEPITEPILLPKEDLKAEMIKKRVLLLEEEIKANPFALISNLPCDLLQEWKALGAHKAPQSVIDKLETLRGTDLYQGLTPYSNWEPQDLNNSFGNNLNADYFSVQIDKLPNGMTSSSLLHMVRTNLNEFVDQNYSTFTPYPLLPSESYIWNGNNPLGAIISIDMGFFDSGTVICTESTSSSWTFKTIRSPYDQEHPVTGNRKFGIKQNSDGTYTFYTMGVDKVTGLMDRVVQNIVGINTTYDPYFDNADKVWGSLIEQVSVYISNNGGSAIAIPNKGERIRSYDEIYDYILGNATLDEVTNDCL